MYKKHNYISPKVDFGKTRPSKAIPDQSLSIQEIVKRYVRGVPADVIQREGTYVDQDDQDLEKMTRMDFGEKHEMASNYAAEAERIKNGLDERQRLDQEAAAKAKADRLKAKAEKAAKNRDETA